MFTLSTTSKKTWNPPKRKGKKKKKDKTSCSETGWNPWTNNKRKTSQDPLRFYCTESLRFSKTPRSWRPSEASAWLPSDRHRSLWTRSESWLPWIEGNRNPLSRQATRTVENPTPKNKTKINQITLTRDIRYFTNPSYHNNKVISQRFLF